MINNTNFSKKIFKKIEKKPFIHLIVDNFLKKKLLKKIINELPNFKDKIWHEYSNYCEEKKPVISGIILNLTHTSSLVI